MAKARKTITALIAIPVAVVAVIAVAWGISYWKMGSGVARNVTLAGVPVGGMSPSRLDVELARVGEQVAGLDVEIKTPQATMSDTAGNIGMSLNVAATRSEVLGVGRDGSALGRPIRWLRSFFSGRSVPASVRTDIETLAPSLVQLEGDRRRDPVEPKLVAGDDKVTMTPGEPGSSMTIRGVVDALPSKLTSLVRPIVIKAQPTEVPPLVSDEEVRALVDAANKATEGPLTVTWGDKKAEIPGAEFRSAFVMTSAGDGEQLSMDADAVSKILSRYTKPPANPSGVRFDIVGGVPTPVGGSDAQVCCGPEAPDLIVKALLKGDKSVPLPFRKVTAEDGRKWAAGLGVKQVIGEFTTRHPCCQARVTNIHRIADIMRGVLIAPGETISVNGIVGKRTKEKGFVSGGVILDGKHTDDVGGGVSQFATTTFNAAFFAGLDIPAYQSHSEWLSRYPFGREATLWYPSVDLKIRNNTPYGVVIWTSYTGTSLTVQMWSTKYVSGEQTAQSPTSGCGRITTTRTRTWVDGRKENDKFFASYRCG